MSTRRLVLAALAVALFVFRPPAHAVGLHVAVATNFRVTVEALLTRFADTSGRGATVSAGSTGQLYAQIRQGAPFDVLLAADAERPRRLEAEGLAVPGTRFTYAMGRLVLWSPDRDLHDARSFLQSRDFRHIALANPDTAPYGAASREVLQHLGLWEPLQSRIVQGQDVGQTYQFVATGNAELGFVALSQVRLGRQPAPRHYWLVPQDLYQPLRQQAVLLRHAEHNPAAKAFLAFLQSDPARRLIEQAGYEVP
jgi:molybdate transport system substrate-binding protein